MQKQKALIFIAITLILITFLGCERDDICAESTPTTPLLIIEFYDIADRTTPKAPGGFFIEDANDPERRRSYTSASISIPLDTSMDATDLLFIINDSNEEDDEDNPRNVDQINFGYERTEEFVSKACGFRITYSNLTQLFDNGPDAVAWIRDIDIINTEITDESSAHLHIFH